MKILQVNKKLIKSFVNFPDELYKGDDKYVPYMKADLTKTLKKLLLQDRSYDALVAIEGKHVLGRVLFTVSKNKQLNTEKCGFFSMFECVDSQVVCNVMLDEMVRILKKRGAKYISGTYFPYDQDNRRGILVDGFDRAPLIFTSYNKTYYGDLLTGYGMVKHTDALEYKIDMHHATKYERLKRVAQYAERKFKFHIDTLDWAHVDGDIADIHTVMEAATTDTIYQDAPSIDALKSIMNEWKSYLNKEYVLIARSNETNQPLGVAIALPDYFQVFQKMRGRMDLRGLIVFACERKKIRSARAILQYVIPKYQAMGVAISMYCAMFETMLNNGVTYLECGTMLENNPQPNEAIKSVGGELARRYRIYYKEI